jgi:hypothetical protein
MFPASTSSLHRHRCSLIQTISAKLLVFYCTFSSKCWILEIWRRRHKFTFMHVSFLFITGYFNFEYRWENTNSWFTFPSSDIAYKNKTMFQPLLEHIKGLCRSINMLPASSLQTANKVFMDSARFVARARNQPLFLSIYPLCMFILWNLSSSGVEKHSGHNLHLNDSPLYIIPHVGIRYLDFNISTLDVCSAKIANYNLH